VKADNIESIARAGADTFVAGSAVFGAKDRAQAMRGLRESLKRATMSA
jgi:ribulose-phosphate 3-epimerase